MTRPTKSLPGSDRTPPWFRLFPPRFRDGFADDLQILYRDLEPSRSRSGRWLEILRTALGTHWDDLWLRRRQAPRRPPAAHSEAAMLDAIRHDLRFAVRTLVRAPMVSGLAVLTLALGIGGTTALFSAIDDVLFHPLSAPDPERIVRLYEQTPAGRFFQLSLEDVHDYGAAARSFDAVGVFRSQSVAVRSA